MAREKNPNTTKIYYKKCIRIDRLISFNNLIKILVFKHPTHWSEGLEKWEILPGFWISHGSNYEEICFPEMWNCVVWYQSTQTICGHVFSTNTNLYVQSNTTYDVIVFITGNRFRSYWPLSGQLTKS